MIAENPRVSALRKSTLSESAPKESSESFFFDGKFFDKVTKSLKIFPGNNLFNSLQ